MKHKNRVVMGNLYFKCAKTKHIHHIRIIIIYKNCRDNFSSNDFPKETGDVARHRMAWLP